jgi:phospholipase C
MNDMGVIKHLIVLMMENRSFDHYLGALTLNGRADVDGLTRPLPVLTDRAGNNVSAWQMDPTLDTALLEVPDPPHGWNAAHADWNTGRNDGFVTQYQLNAPTSTADPKNPMGYYTGTTLSALYALAEKFTVCDRWFSSVLSSTWPNRKYLHSGTRDTDKDTQTLPPFPGFQTKPLYDVLEDCPDPDAPSHKLTRKCYFSDLPFLAFWYQFAASHGSNFTHVADFATDCAEDRLPTISIVDPAFTVADDHPAHNPRLGEKFIALVVDALTNSDSWASSALVVLYDENGGFYDHVPPPSSFGPSDQEDTQLGFRVPALIISPYAKPKFACHTEFDHTSIMKSINVRWKVPFDEREFGKRWQAAPDIWTACFDFNASPILRGTYTGDPITDINWATGVHDRMVKQPDVLEGLMERIFLLPELKALDGRPQVYDTLGSFEQSVVNMKRMTEMAQRREG